MSTNRREPQRKERAPDIELGGEKTLDLHTLIPSAGEEWAATEIRT